MWHVCLKRLSLMMCSQRRLSTNNHSIIDNVIKSLAVNYRHEFDRLQNNENENSMDRIQYLKMMLQAMKIREKLIRDIDETTKLSNESNNDDDISQMATDELARLRTNLNSIDNEILDRILPEEPADNDDAELEVAAGVGGQEAMLFAKDLFQMYTNYANFRKWSFEIVEYDQTDIGGLRQGKAFINGSDVFKSLKYECGVHRVQRVPQTEKSGRIHTSTAMVAVLPQPKDIKIELPAKDLLAEPIRARGPGGQHVNKSESGCRLTHLPTGIVLERQDERFFNLNKNLAIKAMKNKLYQMQYDEQQTRLNQTRKQQTGSGNRNEKIRTYNIPQNRITDERLDENAHHVNEFFDGTHRLHTMIEQLKQQDRIQRLMEQEVLNLANQQIQLAISNALASISSANQSLKPPVLLRCRSSSSNRTNRKVSFHNIMQRCSVPATKNDLVEYQLRLLSYQQKNQTRFHTSSNPNCNRTCDIQYSFSLNQSWLTKFNRQQANLNAIQKFSDEFVEHSIQTALLQIEYQNLSDEHPQELNSYIDQFIHSTIEQALENISSSKIELFSSRLTEDIITDALSTIADNEIYFQKIKKKSIQLENMEQQQTSLFNQILYHSSSMPRSSSSNEKSIDSLVNNIAQQIYSNSFNELRSIFTVDNNH